MPPRKTNKTIRKTTLSKTAKNYRTNKRTQSPTATYTCNSPKFRRVQSECQLRIGSYRNVYTQFSGMKTTFSPTIANKWIKYVNNGNLVYKFTNTDFYKFFGTRWAHSTPKAAYAYLRNKYGIQIKDVTRGNNCWLIAANRTPSGRPFTTYTWK